jgi:DNA-directed RNA polymerase subunit RPC12/RpoP
MDIIFDCPQCEQELAVDGSGAGSEIECPSCGETIVIPASGKEAEDEAAAPAAPTASEAAAAAKAANDRFIPPPSVNAIASSAAAKVEMHLKVPVSAKPTASLIAKVNKPLEVAAKESDKAIRVKTIRHTDCIEVGHDKFDETVTVFLNKVGQKNIISITPLTYTYLDIGSQKIMTEYAVFVVYKG